MNAINLLILYGSIIINIGKTIIPTINRIAMYFVFNPATIAIKKVTNAIFKVTDKFGSKIISRQKTPPTKKKGQKPFNDGVISQYFEKYVALKTTKANLQISDGCIVVKPILIHLLAP